MSRPLRVVQEEQVAGVADQQIRSVPTLCPIHPLHIHLVDFQIISRNGRAPFAYERGPKDVVYVGENEVVRLLMKFTPHKGLYMMHCHNLPHEDHDMMAQFRVGPAAADPDPYDPMTTAKAQWDDEED